ncbi:MAG: MT-A70 family methyltransferase, partial [Burkholderiales bacterium]
SWLSTVASEIAGLAEREAQKLARRHDNQKKQQEVKREILPADGTFDVIVIDPPWPVEKIERDTRPKQVGFDYPTLSEDELSALSLACAEDCHVWLWATQKYLPMAFRLLASWDLKYVVTFAWHKPGGYQPFGLPQYNCEFALYARRGSPV